jgi:PAS domain S-box-containing protein
MITLPESIYRSMIENASDAIVVADKEGVIRLWNARAEAVFGYTPHEALGQTLDLIVPERLRERHWTGYHGVMAAGVSRYGPGELLAVPATRRDGTRISLEFTITLIRDDSGEMIGPAAIIRDVTERWQRDRELRERVAALEAQVEELRRPTSAPRLKDGMSARRPAPSPEAFFAAFPPNIRAIAEDLRSLVKETVPSVIEAVYPGWRLIGYRVVIGKRSAYFGFIAPFEDKVFLGFEYGAFLRTMGA